MLMTDAHRTQLTIDFQSLIMSALLHGVEAMEIDDSYEEAFDRAYQQHQALQEKLRQNSLEARKEKLRNELVDLCKLVQDNIPDVPILTKSQVEDLFDDNVLETLLQLTDKIQEKVSNKMPACESACKNENTSYKCSYPGDEDDAKIRRFIDKL